MRVGRLKRRADFLRLTRTRSRTATGGMVVQAVPFPEGVEPDADIRVGFTASKKVGNSVRRNRAKRRLRALTDEILARRGTPGHDYVLVARAATVERDYDLLRADLTHALKRLGLLRAEAGPC
jgi:ribonuclease P protein component